MDLIYAAVGVVVRSIETALNLAIGPDLLPYTLIALLGVGILVVRWRKTIIAAHAH